MQNFLSQGVRLAFRDIPAHKAPIVLIHGFASNHRVNWIAPRWVELLIQSGRRVVLIDNRGHGASEALYDPAAYAMPVMACDIVNLLDHLDIPRADILGYSMGARIAAFLALAEPGRVRSIILGGLGYHLVDAVGLPLGIAEAMEAPSLAELQDPMQRMFRNFADQNGSDLRALAACIRGSRQSLAEDEVAKIAAPTLIAVGTEDAIAGDPHKLATLFPNGSALDLQGAITTAPSVTVSLRKKRCNF